MFLQDAHSENRGLILAPGLCYKNDNNNNDVPIIIIIVILVVIIMIIIQTIIMYLQ